MITRPMLAQIVECLDDISFPVLATPKLDGIRCLKVNGRALSRTFKPIPNKFIRDYIEAHCPDGVDGEIICINKSFNETQSAVMTFDGQSQFKFVIFDYVKDDLKKSYESRISDLKELNLPEHIEFLFPVSISNQEQLNEYESKCVSEGFEGVMIRSPQSPYKLGRSTVKEGYLLKIKRFYDAEAILLSVDEIVYTKRLDASPSAGMLWVQDVKTGVRFGIGTGLDDSTREYIWKNRDNIKGRLVTYTYQKAGMKDKPRFPVFKGFRNPEDVSND